MFIKLNYFVDSWGRKKISKNNVVVDSVSVLIPCLVNVWCTLCATAKVAFCIPLFPHPIFLICGVLHMISVSVLPLAFISLFLVVLNAVL